MMLSRHWGSLVRALSLALDLIFFSSLAFLAFGFIGKEFALLPIIFALCGVATQAFFLRRFRPALPQGLADTKTCLACKRAISIDAKICRFCLTGVDEQPASTAQLTALELQPKQPAMPAAVGRT
jgi:hypothetical protein